MATGNPSAFEGIVHGKTIELVQDPGLPDGQKVSVTVQPILAPGEGIRRSAGGWSDDPEGLDRYLDELRQRKKRESREIPP